MSCLIGNDRVYIMYDAGLDKTILVVNGQVYDYIYDSEDNMTIALIDWKMSILGNYCYLVLDIDKLDFIMDREKLKQLREIAIYDDLLKD